MIPSNVHCPDCGAYASHERVDEAGDVYDYLVCPSDDCPRVVVIALAVPHRDAPLPDMDARVIRSDADALDALTRALDR